MSDITLPRLFTVREVAAQLRVDPKSVRRLINDHELAAYKLRREWRVSEKDLLLYLRGKWQG
jgi:excisionase family DNA binding protein